MSLMIDIDTIGEVKITGEWFEVLPTREGLSSFDLDAYELCTIWQNWTECKFRTDYQPTSDDCTGCCFNTMRNGKAVVLYAPMSSVEALIENDAWVINKDDKMKEELRKAKASEKKEAI